MASSVSLITSERVNTWPRFGGAFSRQRVARSSSLATSELFEVPLKNFKVGLQHTEDLFGVPGVQPDCSQPHYPGFLVEDELTRIHDALCGLRDFADV